MEIFYLNFFPIHHIQVEALLKIIHSGKIVAVDYQMLFYQLFFFFFITKYFHYEEIKSPKVGERQLFSLKTENYFIQCKNDY